MGHELINPPLVRPASQRSAMGVSEDSRRAPGFLFLFSLPLLLMGVVALLLTDCHLVGLLAALAGPPLLEFLQGLCPPLKN